MIAWLDAVEELGFDAVDDGSLHASWRQQPGTPSRHAGYLAKHARMGRDMADQGAG